MPWVLDAQISFGKVEFDADSVTYKDDALFVTTPQRQFPEARSRMELKFKRAEFELGRRYWCISNVRQPDREDIEHIKSDIVKAEGCIPDWLDSNINVPDGHLPARLGESNIVCDRFKEILEEFEPGKHLFAERDFRAPDHVKPWPVKYWKWQCCHYIDAIIPDIGNEDSRRSTGFFWMMGDPHRLEGFRWPPDRGMFARKSLLDGQSVFSPLNDPPAVDGYNYIPVLNRNAIFGLHAWCDAAFASATNRNMIFCLMK